MKTFVMRRLLQAAMFCVAVTSVTMVKIVQGQDSPDDYLTPHNNARRELKAGIPDLKWNSTLQDDATMLAQNLSQTGLGCVLDIQQSSINYTGPWGLNFFYSPQQTRPQNAVEAWVDGEDEYNYDTNSCDPRKIKECLTYTQVVWADTKFVGCGSAGCANGGEVVICNYSPRGNVLGQKPYVKSGSGKVKSSIVPIIAGVVGGLLLV